MPKILTLGNAQINLALLSTFSYLCTPKKQDMRIDIITVLPEMLESPLGCSILKRAQDKGLCTIAVHNLRDYTTNRYRKVDDYPFGGDAGMVIQVEPVDRCISALKAERDYDEVIFTAPDGEVLNQRMANSPVDARQHYYIVRPLQGHRLPHTRTLDNQGNINRRLCADRGRASGGHHH